MQHLKYFEDFKEAKEKFLKSFENEIQNFLIKNNFYCFAFVFGNHEYDDEGLYEGVHDYAFFSDRSEITVTYSGKFNSYSKLNPEQKIEVDRLIIPLTDPQIFADLFRSSYGAYESIIVYTKGLKDFNIRGVVYEKESF